jgi:hypothetical protein
MKSRATRKEEIIIFGHIKRVVTTISSVWKVKSIRQLGLGEFPMKQRESEALVAQITGGVRVSGPHRHRRRLGYDEESGNQTRLEVFAVSMPSACTPGRKTTAQREESASHRPQGSGRKKAIGKRDAAARNGGQLRRVGPHVISMGAGLFADLGKDSQ